jgi:hypothetical protein
VSLIITDYWMPEMTGYELLKKVKVRATSILFFETWELQYRAHILSCIANGHLHAGVVQAEGDPCGHHVLRERAEHYQQVCLLPSGVGYACPNSEAIHVFFCILFFLLLHMRGVHDQVLGGGSRGFPAQACSRVRRVASVQPRPSLSMGRRPYEYPCMRQQEFVGSVFGLHGEAAAAATSSLVGCS